MNYVLLNRMKYVKNVASEEENKYEIILWSRTHNGNGLNWKMHERRKNSLAIRILGSRQAALNQSGKTNDTK